jgi:hypothetical protein
MYSIVWKFIIVIFNEKFIYFMCLTNGLRTLVSVSLFKICMLKKIKINKRYDFCVLLKYVVVEDKKKKEGYIIKHV